MAKSRWVLLGGGAVGGIALLIAATSFALQGPAALRGLDRDWAAEARAAAQKSILAREADGGDVLDRGDVRFADVKVHTTGSDDERTVCGTFAVRGDDGSQGPFRDFWIVVTRKPGTPADIQAVRMNTIGHDEFLDRNSAYFRSCFTSDSE